MEGERLCGPLSAAEDPANARQGTSSRGPQFIYTEKEKENLYLVRSLPVPTSDADEVWPLAPGSLS